MYKAILFDLDGTLINTEQGIIDCAIETMTDMNIDLPPMDTFYRFIGPPLRKCFAVVAGCDDDTCIKAAKHYLEIFGEKHIKQFEIYKGILPLLDKLKADGVKLGVATYKNQRGADLVLNHFNMAPYFDIIAGTDDAGSITKAQLIARLMKEFGSSGKETLMVGDSPSDYTAARECGCDFAAAVYGFGFREFDDIPGNFAANDPCELAQFIYKQ